MNFGTVLSRSVLDWSSIKWVISFLKALKYWPPQVDDLAYIFMTDCSGMGLLNDLQYSVLIPWG